MRALELSLDRRILPHLTGDFCWGVPWSELSNFDACEPCHLSGLTEHSPRQLDSLIDCNGVCRSLLLGTPWKSLENKRHEVLGGREEGQVWEVLVNARLQKKQVWGRSWGREGETQAFKPTYFLIGSNLDLFHLRTEQKRKAKGGGDLQRSAMGPLNSSASPVAFLGSFLHILSPSCARGITTHAPGKKNYASLCSVLWNENLCFI